VAGWRWILMNSDAAAVGSGHCAGRRSGRI